LNERQVNKNQEDRAEHQRLSEGVKDFASPGTVWSLLGTRIAVRSACRWRPLVGPHRRSVVRTLRPIWGWWQVCVCDNWWWERYSSVEIWRTVSVGLSISQDFKRYL